MFASASNPLIARAGVWLSVAMLLLQSVPSPSCGCSRISTAASSCCSKRQDRSELITNAGCPSTPARQACSSSRRPIQSCCRSHESCCSDQQPPSEGTAGQSCTCDPTCLCQVSRRPAPSPVAPVTVPVNDAEGLAIALSANIDDGVAFAIAPLRAHSRDSEPIAFLSALDCCIALSRFTR